MLGYDFTYVIILLVICVFGNLLESMFSENFSCFFFFYKAYLTMKLGYIKIMEFVNTKKNNEFWCQ
jgi:hypothetical protein